MRWLWISLTIVLIVFGGGYFLLSKAAPPQAFTLVPDNTTTPMKLTSSHFSHNGTIPSKYTCDEDDINPTLSITDVPAGAQSLALIVHDPDAPKEGGWTHWTVWNIPSNTDTIGEGSVPEEAVEGMTDFEEPGYGGPCPPSGTHHYNFTLYALDTTLELESSANKEDVEQAMEGHILETATLTGLYSRD